MNPKQPSLSHNISPSLLKTLEYKTPTEEFFKQATYRSHREDLGSLDFSLGDSHVMPLPGFIEAIQHHAKPRESSWYGYKGNLSKTREVISEALQKQRKISILPEDIFLTNGTAVGLLICLKMLVQEGDEVIINLPPWFCYRRMIYGAGAQPVGIPLLPKTFDLDIAKIADAITEKTRAIIINSPHNPVGKIFSENELVELGKVLTEASNRYGKPIYLISDEAFSRVVFDNKICPSPTQFYPYSFFVYGYSKTWIAPGQRIGYIALPQTMPDRPQIRQLIGQLQGLYFGWCFPSALMQYALEDLEKLDLNLA